MLCLDVEKGRGSRVKRRESNSIKNEREEFGGFFFFFFSGGLKGFQLSLTPRF